MEKIDYPNLFRDFKGREAALRTVVRYHIYQPMYYRSNLFMHSKRVLWLLQSILPLVEEVFGKNFDSTKAQLLAVVHDDPEIVMGDIMAGHKRKMTAAQLADIDRQERAAIVAMGERYPYSVLGYPYEALLLESQELTTIEAKLLKYIDRVDAFGEALHEVFAGNTAFTTPIIDPELGPIDLPVTYYQEYIPSFPIKNPEYQGLFARLHPLFAAPAPFDYGTVVKNSRPHTPASIRISTGYTYYDTWKQIILGSGDTEEIANLYTPKET